MTLAPLCGHWVRSSTGDPVHTPVPDCSTCRTLVRARAELDDDEPLLCTACRQPVDLREPHVRLVNLVQTRTKGATRTHAQRVLGTWHKACSRTWPVPLQRTAPTEEDHA